MKNIHNFIRHVTFSHEDKWRLCFDPKITWLYVEMWHSGSEIYWYNAVRKLSFLERLKMYIHKYNNKWLKRHFSVLIFSLIISDAYQNRIKIVLNTMYFTHLNNAFGSITPLFQSGPTNWQTSCLSRNGQWVIVNDSVCANHPLFTLYAEPIVRAQWNTLTHSSYMPKYFARVKRYPPRVHQFSFHFNILAKLLCSTCKGCFKHLS